MRKLVSLFKFILKIILSNSYTLKAARYAYHKILKNKGNFFYYEKNGLSFVLHRNEIISNAIFLDGEFEFSKFIKSLKFIKKRKRTLIDVGANIGSITIPSLKNNFFKNALTFEPNPESLRLLKTNILINDLEKKVIIKEIALSNVKTSKTLKSDLTFNRGDNRLISKKKRGKNFFNVKTDILDNYTKNYNKDNCLIKIDVQGEESNILISSKKTLSKKIPIIIEFEPLNLKKDWKNCFKYIFKFYSFFYDLKETNTNKQPVSKDKLEQIFQEYLKKRSFTDLLFIWGYIVNFSNFFSNKTRNI